MTAQRETHVFLAQLCDRAGRYDDMVTHMREVARASRELSPEERVLLSTAYGEVVTAQRASIRSISPVTPGSVSGRYDQKIRKELESICKDLLELIDARLLPMATSAVSKVYYHKMKGDYNRYLAEYGTERLQDIAATTAEVAYKTATDIAKAELDATLPLRLGLALNFAVFCHEIRNMHDVACHICKQAIDESLADIGSLSEESFRESTMVMRLLRDNLQLWNSSDADSPEH